MCLVDENPIEPGRDLRVSAKAVEAPICSDEGLLCNIFCCSAITIYEPPSQTDRAIAVGRNEVAKLLIDLGAIGIHCASIFLKQQTAAQMSRLR